MPSIKQSDLDELERAALAARDDASTTRKDAERLRTAARLFDTILDKIVRAANGAPLTDAKNDGGYYGNQWGLARAIDPRDKPSRSERHEQEVSNLQDRIVELERRLAAVNAIAVFAKEHKS